MWMHTFTTQTQLKPSFYCLVPLSKQNAFYRSTYASPYSFSFCLCYDMIWHKCFYAIYLHNFFISFAGPQCESRMLHIPYKPLSQRMIEEPFWLGLITVFVVMGVIGLIWCLKRHFPEKLEKFLSEDLERNRGISWGKLIISTTKIAQKNLAKIQVKNI